MAYRRLSWVWCGRCCFWPGCWVWAAVPLVRQGGEANPSYEVSSWKMEMEYERRNEIPQRVRFFNASMFSLFAIPFLAVVAQFLREYQHAHTPSLRFSPHVINDIAPKPAPECEIVESSKRVISMSLFGPSDKYTVGAIRNAEKMSSIYPGILPPSDQISFRPLPPHPPPPLRIKFSYSMTLDQGGF